MKISHSSAILNLGKSILLSAPFFLSSHAFSAEGSLDEELFGGKTTDESSSSQTIPTGKTRPQETREKFEQTTELESGRKSTLNSDQLTLGGRLELQSVLSKNSNQNVGDSSLFNSTSAEIYLDSRPADELRGFFKAAISSQGSAQSQPAISVSETWLKWGGRGAVFTTLGRQKLKWGAATFWNPTDFFAVQPKDPLANYDIRPGANLLKVHIPFEKSGNNFYALASLENSSRANDPKVAGRAEFNYGVGQFTGELTTTIAGGRNQPQQLGIDLNTAVGPVDLVIESAWTKKSKRNFFRKSTAENGEFAFSSYSRERETIAQVVGGIRYDLKYSESDSANLTAEYFWNDFGSDSAAVEAYSFLQGQSQRLYLAHRYAAVNIFLPQPGPLNDSNVLMTGLCNLADKSWLARINWTEKINQKSQLIVGLARSGGVGEFTGGIPPALAGELRKSIKNSNIDNTLRSLEAIDQEWVLTISAGVDL